MTGAAAQTAGPANILEIGGEDLSASPDPLPDGFRSYLFLFLFPIGTIESLHYLQTHGQWRSSHWPRECSGGSMVRNVGGLLVVLSASLVAQSPCPPVNLLTARTVNLKPSATTHIDAVRQSDGSYTGFEVTDASPYRLIETTPHFERQFAACLPHTIPPVPGTTTPAANPSGAGSQLQVAAPMGPNYFVAHLSADALTLYLDVFDAQHNLLS